jgi:DNA-binding NarL/FixJ family response regulator
MDKVQINIAVIAPLLTQVTVRKAIQNNHYAAFNIIMEESNSCAFSSKMAPDTINKISDVSHTLDILLIHEEDENMLHLYTQKILSALKGREKKPKIFFITSLVVGSQKIITLINKGVSSFYAIENFDIRTLIDALEITQLRGGWIDPYFTITITEQIRDIYRKLNRVKISAKFFQISPSQQCIIELIASGYENEEIAKKLQLSTATIKATVIRLLQKSNCRNRTALVTWAITNNILILNKSG